MMRHRLPILLSAFCIALWMWPCYADAQDISRYSIIGGGELFDREVQSAMRKAPADLGMPRLDCAVEYLRRLSGEEIVYRRGPIDLHQSQPAFKLVDTEQGGYPTGSGNTTVPFHGGMVLDLPRAGETEEQLAVNPSGFHYMVRVAVIPELYADASLRARVVLERAVVEVQGEQVRVLSSEVFSRPVDLEGNLPLKFDLPSWDATADDGTPLIPSSLHEAVLITLETPRHFAIPPSSPDPFSGQTQISYSVPRSSAVKLSIRVLGEERVLDEGRREAGTYDVVWNAADVPDGTYDVRLEASTPDGAALYSEERSVTKDANAAAFNAREAFTPSVKMLDTRRFAVSMESGLAYQTPVDKAKALRNMFTHVALRVGYRVFSWLEAGVVAGQDAFHEKPAANVDIDRISDFGGVVGMTYGYAAPYLRYLPGNTPMSFFAQGSAVFSDAATAVEVAAGLRIALWRQVDGYIGPAMMTHLKHQRSTKFGLHYGMTVRF